MKNRSRINRALAALFAATSLALVAIQGGVALANDGSVDAADYVIWRDNLGGWEGGTNQVQTLDPEWKYVQVRR